MKEVTVKVDMELYSSFNHPIGNFVGSLYSIFEKYVRDNSRTQDHDKQRLVEESFRNALIAVQMMGHNGPRFGYPGEGENAFEILHRNALASDIENVIEKTVLSLKELMSCAGFEVVYHEVYEERDLKMIRTIVKPCCLSVTRVNRQGELTTKE